MKLSKLQELPSTRQMIDFFGGYNHNLRIGEGEFYDMKNLTSSDYPVLSTRPMRGVYSKPYSFGAESEGWKWADNPQGLMEKDALCYVDGSEIVINGRRTDMGLSTAANMCPKTLISMGAYIIIMPDKIYINTGFPVHHQLRELAQTHVHRVSDAIQPSHSLLPFSASTYPLIGCDMALLNNCEVGNRGSEGWKRR